MPSDAFMAIEFAQSKGQARQEGRTGVSFADVAGMDQTLQELQDIVEVSTQPPTSSYTANMCVLDDSCNQTGIGWAGFIRLLLWHNLARNSSDSKCLWVLLCVGEIPGWSQSLPHSAHCLAGEQLRCRATVLKSACCFRSS